jgi:ABC-type proline/glycine betaine transport system ATPase subunit
MKPIIKEKNMSKIEIKSLHLIFGKDKNKALKSYKRARIKLRF